MKRATRDVLCDVLVAMGTALLLVPITVYWLVDLDTARHNWVISGPAPFRYLGSGPLQVWIGVLGIGLGLSLFCVVRRIRRRN